MKFDYPSDMCFRCERCALCCGDTEKRTRTILLLKTEANRISKKALMRPEDFAEKVEGVEPYLYRMKKTNEGKCVFLKGKLCTIYQTRPLICRFYPFELKQVANNRYIFAYTDECPAIEKGPQLRRRYFERLFKKFIKLMKENASVA